MLACTRSGTTGPTTTGPSPKWSATAAPALSGSSTPPRTTTIRSPCMAHSASSPTCRAERRTSSMMDSRARPAASPSGTRPSTTTTAPLDSQPSALARDRTRLVGLGAQHAVDDQRLEPGVPRAAHLRGPGVDLRGGERDLPGVADDRVAHRGRVVRSDGLHRRSPRPPRWSAGPSRRFGGGSQLRSTPAGATPNTSAVTGADPSGSRYHVHEGGDAGLHDHPDPGPVLGGHPPEPRHVPLHAGDRGGGRARRPTLQPTGDLLPVALGVVPLIRRPYFAAAAQVDRSSPDRSARFRWCSAGVHTDLAMRSG